MKVSIDEPFMSFWPFFISSLISNLQIQFYKGSITETLTIKSDESVSSTISDGNENNEETNDGNRNKQECEKREGKSGDIDLATFRSVIGELKELYNEFLLQIKLMQKDLSRAAKCDELESKVRIITLSVSVS